MFTSQRLALTVIALMASGSLHVARAQDCNTSGCETILPTTCKWMPPPGGCAAIADPVMRRLCHLSLFLDGDLNDAIAAGATVMLDQVRDAAGVSPGCTGYDEQPRELLDANGFNISRSVVLFGPDSDPTDAIDDSFLYIGWDIADLATDGVAPVAYDADDDGRACDVAPELIGIVQDDQSDGYSVELQLCADLEQYDPLVLSPNNIGVDQDQFVQPLIFPPVFPFLFINANPGVSAGRIVAFPSADFVTNPTNGCIDREARLCGKGNNVEIVIKRVETLPAFGANALERRFGLAQLVARLGGASTGDRGDEEFASIIVRTPLPAIEVTKEVRCVESGSVDFDSNATALPGALVEYEIVINNQGNKDLDVTVEDVMAAVGAQAGLVTCEPLCETLVAELTRDGVTTPITAANASAFDLNALFFADTCAAPNLGFLGAIRTNQPIRLGLMQGVTATRSNGACLLQPGDEIVLRYQAAPDVSDDVAFCSQLAAPDCSNAVTVRGLFDPPPYFRAGELCECDEQCDDGLYCNGAETCFFGFCEAGTPPCASTVNCDERNDACGLAVEDVADVIDVATEQTAGRDDNVATLDLLCRGFDFLKEVGFPADTNSFVSGELGLQIPPIAPGGFVDIAYRYSGTNTGESPEQITISDFALCADIATADVTLIDCAICAEGGSTTIPVAAGEAYSTSCTIRFTSQAQLVKFMQRDDGRPGCSADPDDTCYRNCASASASPGDMGDACNGAEALIAEGSATVCSDTCDTRVVTEARCLPDCQEPADPDAGWVSDPSVLDVLPGACVQYRITTSNIGSNAICELRFTDCMASSNAFASGPSDVQQSGDASCANLPEFNWDCAPFVCELSNSLLPGQKHAITFMGKVAESAGSAVDPVNHITVEGASFCAGAAPLYFDCPDVSSVGLNVSTCGIAVQKDVTCDDPASPNAIWEPNLVEAIPGATIAFRLRVTNTGEVSWPRVGLFDTLGCPDWLVPGSVTADIGGADVTACICTSGCTTLGDVNGIKDLEACVPGGLAPGNVLTVTLELSVPADFSDTDTAVDCVNNIQAQGYSDVCSVDTDAACATGVDSAEINVLVPSMTCDKAVCADVDDNGDCDGANDHPFTDSLELPCDVEFPIRLIYRGQVTNTGETPLTNVQVCDPDLVADAVAAGISVGPCDLCNDAPPCDGAGDSCAGLADLAPNASAAATCELVVPSYAAWQAFAARDGADSDCHSNGIQTVAEVPLDEICSRDAARQVYASCGAEACIAPLCQIAVEKGVRCIDGCVDRFPQGSAHFAAAAPGDCDGDGVLNLRDFMHLTDCMAGPEHLPEPRDASMTLEACLLVFDFDRDGDVDIRDCAKFESLASGPVDSLAVTPGASVEFEIRVTNTGDQPICTLEFSDILSGDVELCPDPITTVDLVTSNGAVLPCVVPPGWFKDDATLFSIDVLAACGALLESGDALVVQVAAEVDPAAAGIVHNDVCVRCAPDDGSGCTTPAAYCGSEACDEAIVPIQECDFDITKDVACGEPRDAAGLVNGDAFFETQVEALPGSSNGFLITVCNFGGAEISTIGIADVLTCADWYVAGSVYADLDGLDVTECICPGGQCATIDDLNGAHTLEACAGHGLRQGECLNITFEVAIPSDYPAAGLPVDCKNTVTVVGFTDVCSPADNPCPVRDAVATIDVRRPDLECEKTVCADLNTNGTCLDAGDFASTNSLQLPCDVSFPFDLIYTLSATNTGETQLIGVQLCDNGLVAEALAAGFAVGPCDLCTGACDGVDDTCAAAVDLDTNATTTATCTLTVPSREAWLLFAGDGCHINDATAEGAADSAICANDVDPRVFSECSAEVCLQPKCDLIIDCPTNALVDCTEPTDPDHVGTPGIGGNCENIGTIGFRDVVMPGICPQEFTILRTWFATAECDVRAECVQTIEVVDTNGPEITCPQDIEFECDAGSSGVATAIGDCDPDPEITYEDSTTNACPIVTVRTWTARDACGNVNSCEQIIEVDDTEPPVVECPDDMTIDCTDIADLPPLSTNGVVAIDSCGPVTVDCREERSPDTCPLVIERTCVATDLCGNTSTCGYAITVIDTNGPELACPGDIYLECGDAIPPCDTNGVVEGDDCHSVDLTCVDTPQSGDCPTAILREYRAIDECGNVSTCGHYIFIDDDEPPTITCPPDFTHDCAEPLPDCSTDGVIATDSCGFARIECLGDFPGSASQPTCTPGTLGFYNITHNNAGDAAIGESQFFVDVTGGGSKVTFTFRNTGPQPSVITEIYFDDGSLLGIAAIHDNPPGVDYVPDASPPDLPGGNNLVPPFEVTQGFLAEPSAPPAQSGVGPGESLAIEFDLVPGKTLQDVLDELADGTLRIGIRGQSFASGGSESFVNLGCNDTCTSTIVRKYQAVDDCGNISTCGQVITIVDETPPVIEECPTNAFLSCDEEIPACDTNGVIAHDSCGPVHRTCRDVIQPGTCPHEYTILREFVVTDDCGNVSTCGQRIEVSDNEPPVIECPPDQDCTCDPTWYVIDFETDGNLPLPAGYIFDGAYPALGLTVQTDNAVPGHPNLAIVFDSANPTGDDPDLATPGYHPTNTTPYGKVLIIAENVNDTSPPDTLVDDPDDEAGRPAGWIDFALDATYAAAEVVICDTDQEETNGEIEFFMGAVLVGTRPIAVLGDNSIQTIAFAGAEFNRLRVHLPGSGSIPELRLRPLCDPNCDPGDPLVEDNCDEDPTVTCTEEVSTGGFGGSKYSWAWSPGQPQVWLSNSAGIWEAVSGTFDPSTRRLTWEVTFANQVTEGMTFVINNGPMPDQISAVWAMLYLDGNNPANPILTVYSYNGRPDRSSWYDGDPQTPGNQGGDLVASSLLDSSWIHGLSITDAGGKRTFRMDIDATPIINHVPMWPNVDGIPWEGIGFDGGIGMWLGAYIDLFTSYSAGRLTQWQYASPQGYFDTGHLKAEFECEPAEIIRCCTAVDDCGNSAECCHRLIIEDCASCDCSTNGDVTPPLITCPENVTLACGDSTDPGDTGMATAGDDCDAFVSITFSDSLDRDTLITRTWRAVDQCGNASVCHQLITIGGDDNVVVFHETFNGYVSFPDQHPAGDQINAGLPLQTEGAGEHWYGGRFGGAENGTINSDLAVQRFGGDGNNTPVGRVEDDAGMLFLIDTRIYSQATLTFDWRMFDVGSGDRFVMGYYVGDIDFVSDTPDGDNDDRVHRFNADGPAWSVWTERVRGHSTTWRSESIALPTGHEKVWVAFWIDNGHGDFAKIDNVKVKVNCP